MVALQGAMLASLPLLASQRLLDSLRLPRHTYCCVVLDLCVVFATAVGPPVAFAAVGDPGLELLYLLLIAFLLLLLLLLTTFCLLGVPTGTGMASMLLLTCLQ
jgi:hypothetical protein